MKKKILIVMGGSAMGVGGIESMILNYYRHIDKSCLQIDFVFFGEGEGICDEELTKNGSKLFHLPIKSKHYFKSKKAMKKLFLVEKYDIVHANLNAAGILSALKIATKCNIPIRIAHAHSTNHGTTNRIRWILNDWARKQISKYSTNNFACSDLAGKWYFGNEYLIVPNAIDVEKFLFNEDIRREMRKQFCVENKFVVGHVGNLGYPKNQSFLVEVFSELLKTGINAELWLIGEGRDLEDLQEKVNVLELSSKVKFLGRRTDVNKLLQGMDVFVLPSFFEGFPVVIAEAVASDLPCVVSDTITEMVQISDKVQSVSLEAGKKRWVDAIRKAKDLQRENSMELITEKGFNIKIEAKKLENFYKNGRYELCSGLEEV